MSLTYFTKKKNRKEKSSIFALIRHLVIKIKCCKNEPATFKELIKFHVIFQLKKKDFNWSTSYFSKCSSFTTHFQTALYPFSANDRRFFNLKKKLRIKLNHFNSLGKSKLGEKREKTKCWIGRNVFTFILNWKKFPAFLSQIIFFNLVGKKYMRRIDMNKKLYFTNLRLKIFIWNSERTIKFFYEIIEVYQTIFTDFL